PGRIENNLRLVEVLRKAAYVNSNIIQEKSSSKTYQLIQAAELLENYPEDVFELSKNEFKKLNIPKAAHPYIIDYFLNRESLILKDLEEKAYNVVVKNLDDLH
ncbi:MAG: hypothetical protein ACFFDC_12595, partial [Promethearchaeota archaeon]